MEHGPNMDGLPIIWFDLPIFTYEKWWFFSSLSTITRGGYRGARHSIVDGTQVVAIGVRHAVLEKTRPAALKMQPFKGKNICAECRRNQEKYGYNLNMDIIWYDDIRGLPFFVAVAGPWCLDLNLGFGWVWGPPGLFSGGSLGLAFAPPWGCWFYGGSCMLADF